MKRRICAFLLSGVMLGSTFGSTGYTLGIMGNFKVLAETVGEEFVIEDGVLTGYTGENAVVQIPDTVTTIGRGAFKGNTVVEQVIIPDTVSSLELFCFEDCTNLKYVQMGAGVTSIASKCFYNCVSLNQVVVPEGVKKISSMAFMGCSSLADITLPKSLPEGIGSSAFTGTPWLEKILADNNQMAIYDGCLFACGIKEGVVTIPDTVSNCAVQLFAQSGITELVLPDSLHEIPAGFCYGASRLRLVKMGDSVKKIGESAFEGCSALGEISLSLGITALPEGVFASCSSLEKVKLPTSITSIGVRAFANCSKLSEIRLNEGLKKLSWFAFANCDKLTKVVVPDSVIYMDEEAFKDSKQIIIYGNQESYARTYAEKYEIPFLPKSQLEDVLIPGEKEENKSEFYVPELSGLSYSFENAREDFAYPGDYRIPLSAYQYIYGDSVYATNLYEAYPKWGGSCFGMCAFSVMLHAGNTEIKLKDFNANANGIGNLNVTDTNAVLQLSVTKAIESMHVIQNDMSIQRAISENRDDLTAICKAVEKSRESKGQPVIIALYGPEGGHAVIGYKVEQNKLYVYDPNYSQKVRYIELTQRENGTYSDWCYFMNDLYEWRSGKEQCFISYIPYSVYQSVWDGRNSQMGTGANLLQLSVANASICDEEGKEIATVVDGNLVTDQKEMYQVYKMETDGQQVNQGISLYLPPENYQIKNLEEDQLFSATMTNVNQGASVVTQANEISFCVNDEEQLNAVSCQLAQGQTYEMTLRSTLLEQDSVVKIVGTGIEGQSTGVSQKNGELQISNCDNAQVAVDGEKKATHTIVCNRSEGGEVYYKGNLCQVSGKQKIIDGQDATYLFVPEQGYVLVDVLIDQKSVGAVSSYTLENVQGPHEIAAVFTKYENSTTTIETISEQIHTGKPIVPKVTVKIGERILEENKDYSLLFKNNIEVGKATVTVIGLGDYAAINKKQFFYIVAAKGENYVFGDFKYKVTNEKKKTVGVYRLIAKNKKKVTVPEKVKIGACDYKVTEICTNAFGNGKKIRTLLIKTKDLKNVQKNALRGIGVDVRIKVPAKKYKSYKKLMRKKGQKTFKILKFE